MPPNQAASLTPRKQAPYSKAPYSKAPLQAKQDNDPQKSSENHCNPAAHTSSNPVVQQDARWNAHGTSSAKQRVQGTKPTDEDLFDSLNEARIGLGNWRNLAGGQ